LLSEISAGQKARAVPASGVYVPGVFASDGSGQAGQQVCRTVAVPEARIARGSCYREVVAAGVEAATRIMPGGFV
jgi:hypothetical protein